MAKTYTLEFKGPSGSDTYTIIANAGTEVNVRRVVKALIKMNESNDVPVEEVMVDPSLNDDDQFPIDMAVDVRVLWYGEDLDDYFDWMECTLTLRECKAHYTMSKFN